MKFLLFTLLLSLGDVDHGRGRAISAAVTPNSSGASVGPLARNLSPATGVASRNDTVDWAEICSGDKKNETCEDVCREDPVPGPCRALISRWWYNGQYCENFMYGGCNGGRNSFESPEQCQKACGKFKFPQLVLLDD